MMIRAPQFSSQRTSPGLQRLSRMARLPKFSRLVPLVPFAAQADQFTRRSQPVSRPVLPAFSAKVAAGASNPFVSQSAVRFGDDTDEDDAAGSPQSDEAGTSGSDEPVTPLGQMEAALAGEDAEALANRMNDLGIGEDMETGFQTVAETLDPQRMNAQPVVDYLVSVLQGYVVGPARPFVAARNALQHLATERNVPEAEAVMDTNVATAIERREFFESLSDLLMASNQDALDIAAYLDSDLDDTMPTDLIAQAYHAVAEHVSPGRIDDMSVLTAYFQERLANPQPEDPQRYDVEARALRHMAHERDIPEAQAVLTAVQPVIDRFIFGQIGTDGEPYAAFEEHGDLASDSMLQMSFRTCRETDAPTAILIGTYWLERAAQGDIAARHWFSINQRNFEYLIMAAQSDDGSGDVTYPEGLVQTALTEAQDAEIELNLTPDEPQEPRPYVNYMMFTGVYELTTRPFGSVDHNGLIERLQGSADDFDHGAALQTLMHYLPDNPQSHQVALAHIVNTGVEQPDVIVPALVNEIDPDAEVGILYRTANAVRSLYVLAHGHEVEEATEALAQVQELLNTRVRDSASEQPPEAVIKVMGDTATTETLTQLWDAHVAEGDDTLLSWIGVSLLRRAAHGDEDAQAAFEDRQSVFQEKCHAAYGFRLVREARDMAAHVHLETPLTIETPEGSHLNEGLIVSLYSLTKEFDASRGAQEIYEELDTALGGQFTQAQAVDNFLRNTFGFYPTDDERAVFKREVAYRLVGEQGSEHEVPLLVERIEQHDNDKNFSLMDMDGAVKALQYMAWTRDIAEARNALEEQQATIDAYAKGVVASMEAHIAWREVAPLVSTDLLQETWDKHFNADEAVTNDLGYAVLSGLREKSNQGSEPDRELLHTCNLALRPDRYAMSGQLTSADVPTLDAKIDPDTSHPTVMASNWRALQVLAYSQDVAEALAVIEQKQSAVDVWVQSLAASGNEHQVLDQLGDLLSVDALLGLWGTHYVAEPPREGQPLAEGDSEVIGYVPETDRLLGPIARGLYIQSDRGNRGAQSALELVLDQFNGDRGMPLPGYEALGAGLFPDDDGIPMAAMQAPWLGMGTATPEEVFLQQVREIHASAWGPLNNEDSRQWFVDQPSEDLIPDGAFETRQQLVDAVVEQVVTEADEIPLHQALMTHADAASNEWLERRWDIFTGNATDSTGETYEAAAIAIGMAWLRKADRELHGMDTSGSELVVPDQPSASRDLFMARKADFEQLVRESQNPTLITTAMLLATRVHVELDGMPDAAQLVDDAWETLEQAAGEDNVD